MGQLIKRLTHTVDELLNLNVPRLGIELEWVERDVQKLVNKNHLRRLFISDCDENFRFFLK